TAHDHPGRQGPRYLAQQRQRRVAAQDPQGSRFAIVGLPEENESRAVGPGGKAVSPEAAAGRISTAAAELVLFFVNRLGRPPTKARGSKTQAHGSVFSCKFSVSEKSKDQAEALRTQRFTERRETQEHSPFAARRKQE